MKVEIEHRGILTNEKFKQLNKFFQTKGKFLGKKKRFSVIYFLTNKKIKKIEELKNEKIDLRIRITNKKTELVMKYGKWGATEARREFLFLIKSEQFDQMIEFLKILGFYQGVLNATETYLYKYRGIDFALVKVPSWGYYFEAEIMGEKRQIKKLNEKILTESKKLGLEIFTNNALCQLLDQLNNRKGFRFNFKKEKFLDIKKRFINYF